MMHFHWWNYILWFLLCDGASIDLVWYKSILFFRRYAQKLWRPL